MKLSWLFISVVLIHSFFTCASAAGHVEDTHHQSVDVVSDNVHDIEYQNSDESSDKAQTDVEHEHQFHAHTSCLTGYGISVSAAPVTHASTAKSVEFGQSITHQPPVPPPNA
jgi:hypothetical protein